jgi:hypothetical protein
VHVLQVEVQIEAVSRSVDEATKALPNLSKDQQTAQVSAHATPALCRTNNIALTCAGQEGTTSAWAHHLPIQSMHLEHLPTQVVSMNTIFNLTQPSHSNCLYCITPRGIV